MLYLGLNTSLQGTWTYVTGSLIATGTLSGSGRCNGLRVFANAVDSSFTINGGATITLRANSGLDISSGANLLNPSVVWVSGSIDVFIELLN